MDKEFDFSKAKPVDELPAIQQLRQAHHRSLRCHFIQGSLQSSSDLFDDDVIAWVAEQDSDTKLAINNVIRQFMIVKSSASSVPA